MSTLGSLAPWYGAKRTLASRIVDVIGPHRTYWEPFCGSMAVLLGKPPVANETVNDLHDDLVNLARVIRHPKAGAVFLRRARRTLFSEALFRESREVVLAPFEAALDPDVDRAYHYFVFSWMGLNGVGGTEVESGGNFARRFTSQGGGAGTRWLSALRSIVGWRGRLSAVTILQSDGIELCERIEDREGTVIYCDPPYLKKSVKYKHEFTPDDHSRLADALGRYRKTRVIVSYYQHPRLAELYPGWQVIACDVARGMYQTGNGGGESTTKAPEVLLVNQADEELFFGGSRA